MKIEEMGQDELRHEVRSGEGMIPTEESLERRKEIIASQEHSINSNEDNDSDEISSDDNNLDPEGSQETLNTEDRAILKQKKKERRAALKAQRE